MKIDHDLRQAIKAAFEKQRYRNNSFEKREEAVADFFKSCPTVSKKFKELKSKYLKIQAEAYKASQELQRFADQFGINNVHSKAPTVEDTVEGAEKFRKAGGKWDWKAPWKYNDVIAELAAADPKDAAKILAKYGIRWD